MARWTNWRKIATRRDWFDDELDWDGPACYELALAGPRRGGLLIVYVGETLNEKRRVATYARHGSHLSEIINNHLRGGWYLYYRACAVSSKSAAVAMQNNLLAQWEYDWNIQLNER
jgi:GIY-YIG catalytic domain-containing protein